MKKVSAWGPPGTSMHSVSRLPTRVGRIITSTVGGSCLASIAFSVDAGYWSSEISFSGVPG